MYACIDFTNTLCNNEVYLQCKAPIFRSCLCRCDDDILENERTCRQGCSNGRLTNNFNESARVAIMRHDCISPFGYQSVVPKCSKTLKTFFDDIDCEILVLASDLRLWRQLNIGCVDSDLSDDRVELHRHPYFVFVMDDEKLYPFLSADEEKDQYDIEHCKFQEKYAILEKKFKHQQFVFFQCKTSQSTNV
ncbi:hypothetical protein RFI_29144 [Reticulomyxa filosa]|uniref:Uncharacterized protein n=1 Tax=Reticulomyxa filosa TaxID=46433 RepID=X6M251_RETFI|nr:hypothetical protein RFI_29144 [Reticulomyxa filosa]|eukprot:ETO08248.1 hypothetical protein RFI_29144 [Reticulomyxa filosa]